jgi:hypothetical protein
VARAAASLIWRSSLVEIGDEEGEEYGAAGVDGGWDMFTAGVSGGRGRENDKKNYHICTELVS